MSNRDVPDVSVLADARSFADPGAGGLRQHCGLHPDIIMRMINNRIFEEYLVDVRDRVLEAIRTFMNPSVASPRTFNIGVYCRAGMHRSVALAQILRRVLELEGYEAVWLPLNRRPMIHAQRCVACSERPQSLIDAFDFAHDLWRSNV